MSELVVDLTSGLYQFMLNSEQLLLSTPRKKKEEIGRQLVEQSLQLLERYNTARQQVGERFIERFDDISQSLRSFSNELKKRSWTPETMWSHWHKLSLQYEALLAQAKQLRLRDLSKVRIAHLKPRNFSRNIFHFLVGVTCVLSYELLLSREALIAVGLIASFTFFGMDLLRRFSATWNKRFVHSIFNKISRPGEAYKIPSATWYVIALTIGVAFMPKIAIELSTLVLAVGDPIASLVGKRWGNLKIFGEKSFVGSLGFFFSSSIAAYIFLSLFSSAGFAFHLLLAGLVGLVGALVELFTGPVDDNFSIPLLVGLAATLMVI